MISAFVNRPDRDPNIGIVERVAYGMGDFSSQLILTPVSMLFLYYATEFVNINISIVGGIMLASRVFDGFSDLFVGYLIEKTKRQDPCLDLAHADPLFPVRYCHLLGA